MNTANNVTCNVLKPVVKWAGGKRRLLSQILPRVPAEYSAYAEPFLGGGALLFALQPQKAIANDINSELMNTYKVIRDQPNELIRDLQKHENTAKYYYVLRNLDRDKAVYSELTDVQKASRFLYLNHTCFNGLHRVNRAGEFNVPFGDYAHPNIIAEDSILAMAAYLRSGNIQLTDQDFTETCAVLPSGSFVYFDPPYDSDLDKICFTAYASSGFTRFDQERLKDCCDALTARGVHFLLSNAATDYIKDLYREYTVQTIPAPRSISASSARRGYTDEVLIANYY